jgi:hypothetical protein
MDDGANTYMKWGYFEVGAYIGTQGERERVLNDFILGRLDVGSSNLFEAFKPFFSQTCLDSRHVIRHRAALRIVS